MTRLNRTLHLVMPASLGQAVSLVMPSNHPRSHYLVVVRTRGWPWYFLGPDMGGRRLVYREMTMRVWCLGGGQRDGDKDSSETAADLLGELRARAK